MATYVVACDLDDPAQNFFELTRRIDAMSTSECSLRNLHSTSPRMTRSNL